MKKQVVNISVVQSSKFVAVLYFVVSLPIVLVVAAIALAKGQGLGPAVFALIFPLIYALGAYLGTAFSAWLYNLVAKQVGGVEFTTAEVVERA